MDYIFDGVVVVYWEIVCELKFWKNLFLVYVEYNGGFVKGFFYQNVYLGGVIYIYNNIVFLCGFLLLVMYKYIQKYYFFNNFQLIGIWYMNFSNNLFIFFGFVDWWCEEIVYGKIIFFIEFQFWVNLNCIKGISDKFKLSVGLEVELSNNFGGCDGFYVIFILVLKWIIN